MRPFLPLGLFLVLLVSCSACESDLSTGEVVLPNDAATDFAPFATATLALINDVRNNGCTCGSQNMPSVAALELHPELVVAAQGHSEDQADMGEMQHQGSDGSSVGSRVTRAGFEWRSVGENIAWNYPNVDALVEGWLSSPGHCRNIMKADFKYMGMGEEDLYWTQVFAR